jgi:hypothetical protein
VKHKVADWKWIDTEQLQRFTDYHSHLYAIVCARQLWQRNMRVLQVVSPVAVVRNVAWDAIVRRPQR